MYTRKRLVNLEILVQMIVFLKCAQVLIFPWFGCVRLIELQPKNCRCRVYVEIYISYQKVTSCQQYMAKKILDIDIRI